jgi:hypothetical protein
VSVHTLCSSTQYLLFWKGKKKMSTPRKLNRQSIWPPFRLSAHSHALSFFFIFSRWEKKIINKAELDGPRTNVSIVQRRVGTHLH